MIKILQNGIKHDNGYTPCFYSMGNTSHHSNRCITIYARDYERLPAELGAVENDTDTQTDYFDSDKVYLEPGDKYYTEALAAYNKRRLADSKRLLKHDEKRLLEQQRDFRNSFDLGGGLTDYELKTELLLLDKIRKAEIETGSSESDNELRIVIEDKDRMYTTEERLAEFNKLMGYKDEPTEETPEDNSEEAN